MSTTENSFLLDAEKVCRLAMKESQGLTEALQSCEGLFPTLAMSHFSKLNSDLMNRWVTDARHTRLTADSSQVKQESFPLSTWIFSHRSRKELSKVLWDGSVRVCLLGVPSLVDFLPTVIGAKRHLLVDLLGSNVFNPEQVSKLSYDINLLDGSEFFGAFDVCVLDPPWYVADYVKWISIAASYCKNNGIVAFPLLGRMTKPTAKLDRKQILSFCRSFGLQVQVLRGAILYDPPSFERSMLLRSGIPAVQWKRADLVLARCCSKSNVIDTPTRQPSPMKPLVRIKVGKVVADIVLDRFDDQKDRCVRIPQGGYWMKTPSRREGGLAECNVFFSNGARFISDRPFNLLAQLEQINNIPTGGQRVQLVNLGFPDDVFTAKDFFSETNSLQSQLKKS